MEVFIAMLYCHVCNRKTPQQIYALTFAAQHVCAQCGDVTITKIKEVA